ncbi:hypothetical protein M569_07817, partial [Genlisea aurea]
SDNFRGFILAFVSSIFIGSSYVVKKIGLQKAGASGTRAAGDGGFSYLIEPWWWAGMITMVVGEAANFAAYAYAPAILVTPLGAVSIIFRCWLAHFILGERMHAFGVVGCVLCLIGSTVIVLHAPLDKKIESVRQVWHLATQPGFLVYFLVTLAMAASLIFVYAPRYGQTNMMVYVGICSLMGSLTVMGVKAVAIALKLSFSGLNQFVYLETWFFTILVVVFCMLQLIYLNKALDIFQTGVVSPLYYVMFTTLTIIASTIMFKEWEFEDGTQMAMEWCGFVTILCGILILHKTKDMGGGGASVL